MSKELVRVGLLASALQRELREELEKALRVMNPKPRHEVARVTESARMLEDVFRQKLLPRFFRLHEELDALVNARRQQLEVELAAKKRLAQIYSRAAIVLYAMGSVLALAGQVGDKILGSTP